MRGGKADRGESAEDRENRKFFDEHKDEEWFSERYDPRQAQALKENLIARAQNEAEKFATELGNGQLKPCYDYVEFKKEGSKDASKPEGQLTEDAEEGEAAGEEPCGEAQPEDADQIVTTTIFIKSVPPKLKRAQLQEFLQPESLKFSEPLATKDWTRTAWAIYDSAEACSAAFEKCKGETVEGFSLDLALTPPNRLRNGAVRPKVLARNFADERRILHDLEQARQLVRHLDVEKGIVPNESLASDQSEKNSVDLDLAIFYLQRVHLYDYYSGEEFGSTADLETRFPGGSIRGRAPEVEKEDRFTSKHEIVLDEKVRYRLGNKWALDGRSLGERLERWQKGFLADNTYKVDDDKYGCRLSEKLFMAEEFVHKHILNKHQDKLNAAKAEAYENLYFDNYSKDPMRPRTHVPFSPGMRPMGFGKGGSWGKGFGGKGEWGKGYKGGKGYDRFRGRSPPRHDRRRSPPRDRRMGTGPSRSMRSYQDLDELNIDVAPINFDELDALEAQLGHIDGDNK